MRGPRARRGAVCVLAAALLAAGPAPAAPFALAIPASLRGSRGPAAQRPVAVVTATGAASQRPVAVRGAESFAEYYARRQKQAEGAAAGAGPDGGR